MPGKSSQELLQAHIEAERKAARERVAQITEAEQAQRLAAVAVNAKFNTPPPDVTTPLAAKLPRAAKMAMDTLGRVFNPKIHEHDVARFGGRPFAVLPWLNAVDATLGLHRKTGDVLPAIIFRVAEVIGWDARDTEKVEKAFAKIAAKARCCIETARKAVRWLEHHNLLDTFNVLRRVGKALERGPNLYLPVMPPAAPAVAVDAPASDAPAAEPPAEKLSPLARAEARLARWASRFGLVARGWGLNATPIATKHLRSERDPAPA